MNNKVGWDDIVAGHEWDHEANVMRIRLAGSPPRIARIDGRYLLEVLAGEDHPDLSLPGWDGTVLICGVPYRMERGMDMGYLIVEKVDPGNGA